jgi:hypothetical protein
VKTVTIAGPMSESSANETAQYLGIKNHSVYSRAVRDAEGFDTEAREWFVERDNDIVPDRILGYEWSDIQSMQQRKRGAA